MYQSQKDSKTILAHLKSGIEKEFPFLLQASVDSKNEIYFGVDPQTQALVSHSMANQKKRYSENFGGGKVQHITQEDLMGDVYAIVEFPGKTQVMKYNLKTANYSVQDTYNRTFSWVEFQNSNPDFITVYPDISIKKRQAIKTNIEILGKKKSLTLASPYPSVSEDPNNTVKIFVPTFNLNPLASSDDATLLAFKNPQGSVVTANLKTGATPPPMLFTKTRGSIQNVSDPPMSAHFIDENALILSFYDRLEVVDPNTHERRVLVKSKYSLPAPFALVGQTDMSSTWYAVIESKPTLVTVEFECSHHQGVAGGAGAKTKAKAKK